MRKTLIAACLGGLLSLCLMGATVTLWRSGGTYKLFGVNINTDEFLQGVAIAYAELDFGTSTGGTESGNYLIGRQRGGTTSGTHDGAGNASILTDSGETWVADQWIGHIVTNTTDGSFCVVTDNDATTITCTLAGGSENDWDASDAYTVSGYLSAALDVSDASKMVCKIEFSAAAAATASGWVFASDHQGTANWTIVGSWSSGNTGLTDAVVDTLEDSAITNTHGVELTMDVLGYKQVKILLNSDVGASQWVSVWCDSI